MWPVFVISSAIPTPAERSGHSYSSLQLNQETYRSHLMLSRAPKATSWSQDSGGGKSDMRKGEKTRHDIIRKAAPLFNQKGYESAALSDLMQATGLEKGLLSEKCNQRSAGNGSRAQQ